MNEEPEIIIRPKTNCVKVGNTKVACNDYIRADGERNFNCCNSCGWNPEVAKRRISQRWRV